MQEKTHATRCGEIHYWISRSPDGAKPTLMFLPGLTADHRLFDKQVEYFRDKYNVFVWDAPGHAASWPFSFDFSLMDKARWLDEIIEKEGITAPVIIGQSMGGYVGQAYSELYPEKLAGFVAVDSAPLQREYMSSWEIWLLKRIEPVYRLYPWKLLVRDGSKGVAVTEYGRRLMFDMMSVYDGNQDRYVKLSGHGYKILAEAIEADLKYELKCPVLLICGRKDRAGSCIRYCKEWSRKTGFSIEWIENAGHNSNTDRPECVNGLIEEFVGRV